MRANQPADNIQYNKSELVSQQRLVEESLRQSEEKYRTLFDTLTQGIIYQDADGKITSANPAAQRILGVSLSQLQGLTSTDPRWKAIREDGSDFPGHMHPLSVALRTGQEVRNVVHGVFHPEKGSHVWIQVTAVPLFRPGEKKPYQAYATFDDITERKRTEENYQTLFREMLDGCALHEIIVNDLGVPVDYRFLAVNPAFERMTGLKAIDILGRTAMEALPGTEKYWVEAYGKVALSGEPVFFENYSSVLKKYFEVTAYRPAPKQFACIFSDVTERKIAIEELKLANQKLEAFWDIATVENAGVKTICDHVLLSITKMTESVFGFYGFINEEESVMTIHSWSGEAMKGCSMVTKPTLFPIAQAGVWGEAVRQRQSLILNDYEASHPAKKGLPDGHVRLKNLMVVPVFSHGKIVAVAAVANRKSDYSETDAKHLSAFAEAIQALIDRKLGEEALRESEQQYRTLADSGQALIWTSDTNKKCNYFNRTWLDFTGRTMEQELNDGWVEGVHPDDVERCIATFVSFFDRREPFSMDYRLRHRDGKFRWIQDNGTPRYDSKGNFLGYIGHCLDITEHRQAEEALRKVQKLESLGILAGGIAHDFNNILSMIFGYVEMASFKSRDAQISNLLSKSLTAMNRARGLTSQLLTFAKGGEPVRTIGPLFPFVQETAQFALSGSNVICRFDIAEDLKESNYDQNQIGQVIDNIIINAQQAMPMGGTLEISAKNIPVKKHPHSTLSEGEYIRISIKDTGTGIPHEMLPLIFDPFFTTKTKGHGLGLATSYSIVQRHKGNIDVESEPGKGTTFHIYLPAADGTSSTIQSNPILHKKRGGTFIIMDDEEGVLETTQYMLKEMGYSVVCKTDGASAIAFFTEELKANRAVAGILMDLTIPGGMGGKMAIAEIRKLCTKTPVFVSSGYAEDPVMANPIEYGFTASISKPFRMHELAAMLEKYSI